MWLFELGVIIYYLFGVNSYNHMAKLHFLILTRQKKIFKSRIDTFLVLISLRLPAVASGCLRSY